MINPSFCHVIEKTTNAWHRVAVVLILLAGSIVFLLLSQNTAFIEAEGKQNKAKLNLDTNSSYSHFVKSERNAKLNFTASANFFPAHQELIDSIQTMIEPRVWDFWPVNRSLPCFPPHPQHGWDHEFLEGRGNYSAPGLFMARPVKVGSSTTAGVHIRIMHKLAKRQGLDFPVCRGTFHHQYGSKYATISKESLLWSIVRDPTKRAISMFFFQWATGWNVEPSDENFFLALNTPFPKGNKVSKFGHYGEILGFRANGLDPVKVHTNILKSYNFIGVTERMDESLVVFKELLGLRTSDILHFNSKRSGKSEMVTADGSCAFIRPSFLSPLMKKFFVSQEWLSSVKYDMALHVAVNKSLDLTIKKRIGQARFASAFEEYKQAQKKVHSLCKEPPPCKEKQKKIERATDCYWDDCGCGYSCIDTLTAGNSSFS